MSHSYGKLLFHCVFSTKERRPTIDADWQDRLYRYASGIIKENRGHLLRAGGVADHVHLLLELPLALSVADAMRVIKTNTSKWVHETFPASQNFSWQTGYGAFSVSQSQVDAVVAYIDGQEEHHRTMTFQEEFRRLLERHGIEFDEHHLWD